MFLLQGLQFIYGIIFIELLLIIQLNISSTDLNMYKQLIDLHDINLFLL